MPQANISIRVDKTVKERFSDLCDKFGLSTTAAFNLFMKAVIRERKIPFDIAADDSNVYEQKGLQAFDLLRQQALKNDIQDMPLEEINTLIKESRDERRSKAN